MERVYSFTFENKTGGGRSPSPIANSSVASNEQRKGLLTKEGARAFAKGMVVYHTVKSFGEQIWNHNVSMVALRTGSNELQDRAAFTHMVHQKALGVLEAVGTGALLGGLPGALVGLALGTAHTVMGYQQAQQRIDTERSVENVGLMMMNIRAGANGSRHI